MNELVPGLYELLVTEAVQQLLERLPEAGRKVDGLEPGSSAEAIAQLLHERLLQALKSLRSEDRVTLQVGLANQVLELLRAAASDAGLTVLDRLREPGQVLLEILDRAGQRLGSEAGLTRPGIPLRSSDLLVNGPRDLRVGWEIQRELGSADRVDLLCAFLKWSGLRVLRGALEELLDRRPGNLRVLTTAYMGATERKALDFLANLGARVKVSYDVQQTRLHAKAWLFHRDSGYSTALVGSSNLSAAALLDGLEWNVRLAQKDNPAILAKFRATFDQYWADPEFHDYQPDRDGPRFDECVRRQQAEPGALILTIQVEPRPHQIEILEALEVERAAGHCRNLVVAATGTGKTFVAAFDYQRLCAQGHGRPSLLFVAHRQEILEQSRRIFQLVLQDGDFGELLVGGGVPRQGRHVFASIQSLHRERLATLEPAAYELLIVDEFHHAEADTYRALLGRLRPRLLLGLTATPERADGKSVLEWFDGRVTAELRLWKALDQGLLSPFQYFGISDDTDLEHVEWKRGRYDLASLQRLYTGNHERMRRVLGGLREHVADPGRMRALGFCAGVEHARFMAQEFERAGLASVAVWSETPAEERRAALRRLRDGELRAVFTVDLFNEGVDIPAVDTVLFLRPTESATIFLQQLGRGLRRSSGKECLTVLDFIGNAHRKFRFDARYRALLGGTRREVKAHIEEGFPYLPAGCSMQLDRIAHEAVLGNIRHALQLGERGLVEDLSGLGRDVGLATFLDAAGVDLDEVYSGSGRYWTRLRRKAGLPAPPPQAGEEHAARPLARMLHADDPLRIDTWLAWFGQSAPPPVPELTSVEGRLLLMLFVALGHGQRPTEELRPALEELWSHPVLLAELRELLGILRDRLRHRVTPLDLVGGTPLQVHATYNRDEVMAAFADIRNGKVYLPREGVLFLSAAKSDLLFVTLQKTVKEYSPTTMYQDYPLSMRLFHWESQSGTSESSPTGQRYIHHESQGRSVLIFVRQRKKDSRGETLPYLFLGPARYVSHEGERPMQIVWELEQPMPADFYQAAKLAAG